MAMATQNFPLRGQPLIFIKLTVQSEVKPPATTNMYGANSVV